MRPKSDFPNHLRQNGCHWFVNPIPRLSVNPSTNPEYFQVQVSTPPDIDNNAVNGLDFRHSARLSGDAMAVHTQHANAQDRWHAKKLRYDWYLHRLLNRTVAAMRSLAHSNNFVRLKSFLERSTWFYRLSNWVISIASNLYLGAKVISRPSRSTLMVCGIHFLPAKESFSGGTS